MKREPTFHVSVRHNRRNIYGATIVAREDSTECVAWSDAQVEGTKDAVSSLLLMCLWDLQQDTPFADRIKELLHSIDDSAAEPTVKTEAPDWLMSDADGELPF